MFARLFIGIALWWLLWVPGAAVASPAGPEGMSRFGLSLWSPDTTDPNGFWSIAVGTYSEVHPATATALVDVRVGPSAEVVRGETRKVVHPSMLWTGVPDNHWLITLRKLHDGPLEIVGSLRLTGPGDVVEYRSDVRLTLEVSGSSILVRENRPIIEFGTEDGRRVRYGGFWLVAMDPDELELPDAAGVQPRLLDDSTLTCSACRLAGPVDVKLLVTVGRAGRVTWVRPASGSAPMDTLVWGVIARGIEKLRFQPATSRGRPVAEAAVLTIRVVPAK